MAEFFHCLPETITTLLIGYTPIQKKTFKKKKKTALNYSLYGIPWRLSGKESACNAGEVGSICGSERSPGEGNSNPPQYSCLGNPTERGAWQAAVHGVAKETDWT